jgi:hypothetical protein
MRGLICYQGQITDNCATHSKLNGRLSIYRGQVKRTATNKVEGFYQLLEGEGCVEKIKGLLVASMYIYPTRLVGVSSWSHVMFRIGLTD